MNASRERGFSLIEMLITLLVIVLFTSLVTLNLGSGAGERERDQLAMALRDGVQYALDEAQFAGRDFGLLLQRDEGVDPAYFLRWRERQPQGWRPPAQGTDVFVDLRLAGELTLTLDGLLISPADSGAGEALAGTAPQWQFLASGETQTGELLWRDDVSGEALWRMEWDALGRLSLFRGDDSEAFARAY